jgi:hypothetical protein
MHKRKTWKCSTCGDEVPDLPMSVLRHRLSHVKPRPFARDQRKPQQRDQPHDQDPAER